MDGAVLVGPRQQRGVVHRRILERVDDGEVVLGFDAERIGDVEGAAAVVLGVLLAVEVEGHGLGVERRAVRELHVGPELVGPGLEVGGRRPRQSEAGLGLAVLAEPGELLEEQAGGDVGRGVVDADLQGIEARDVELDADGERAALLLGERRRGCEAGDGGQRKHDLEQTRVRWASWCSSQNGRHLPLLHGRTVDGVVRSRPPAPHCRERATPVARLCRSHRP